jgi:N-acetylmuramoyl-L-alanine amidase
LSKEIFRASIFQRADRNKKVCVIILAVFVLGIAYQWSITRSIPVLQSFINTKTVVIDPGHGTVEPGVVHKSSGIEESKINLDVGQKLKKMLLSKNYNVVMTREKETRKKLPIREDLKKRVDVAKSVSADIFVSIHVNQFTDSKYFGAQCFFFPHKEDSKILALLIQEELKRLQPNNHRKPLAKDLYVLRETPMPAVLVEIGFLSNDVDRHKLTDPDYRNKIAEAIFKGIQRYFEGNIPTT